MIIFIAQYSDYHEIPKAFGGKGILINRDNEADIEKALEGARKAHAEGNSVLVNVLIGRTDFRDGSISV